MDEVMRVEPQEEIDVPVRRGRETRALPPRRSEKGVIYKPGRRLSPGTESADTYLGLSSFRQQ